MTPDEFRAELSRLRSTQGGMARYLEYDTRTLRRWLTGEKEIPKAVAELLPRLKAKDVREA